MKALVSPSCRLDHVCEPVRYTARPVGSAKYRGFVGCTLNGPVAGLGSARRGDVPKTIVRHSTTIEVRTVLVLDCTMWLHSFWMTQSTRYQAFDLGRDGVRWQVTGRVGLYSASFIAWMLCVHLRDAQYSIHPFYRLPALSPGLSSFRRSNNLVCRKLSKRRDAARCRTSVRATHVPRKNRS